MSWRSKVHRPLMVQTIDRTLLRPISMALSIRAGRMKTSSCGGPHEIYKHYVTLHAPPSPELPYRMLTLLKIEPAVAKELTEPTVTEKASTCCT
jgi:hypothetical protein